MSAAVRCASMLLGVAFGFMLSWGRMTSPDAIQDMLLLEDPYLYLMMASTIAVAYPGVRLVRGIQGRALLTGDQVSLAQDRPRRQHLVGAAVFGLGWAVSVTCPGPISAQLGQGYAWALVTVVGMGLGIWLGARSGQAGQRGAAVLDDASVGQD